METYNLRRKSITANEAKTLFGLFKKRIQFSPKRTAYRYFDTSLGDWHSLTWKQTANIVAQWQAALIKENLLIGDRVGFMLRTCVESTLFEIAAIGLGLVSVPLFVQDRLENTLFIIKNTGIKLLLVENTNQQNRLLSQTKELQDLRVISLDTIANWLPEPNHFELIDKQTNPDAIVAIYHTSGTTGRSKGAMFSHKNILANIEATSKTIAFHNNDVIVPFIGGYFLSMLVDITIAYPRSFEDLKIIRPTLIVSSANIYVYFYKYIQNQLIQKSKWMQWLFQLTVHIGWLRFQVKNGREKYSKKLLLWPLLNILVARHLRNQLGGQVRFGLYASERLSSKISRTMLGLGLSILSCYGQTEAGPVISVNRPNDNMPASVGIPLEHVMIRLDNMSSYQTQTKNKMGEIAIKTPGIMKGYWNNDLATQRVLDNDGWLHTGDVVQIDSQGRLYFVDRVINLLVMQNGEYISPIKIETELISDSLFDQAMVIGKDKPFLTALIVLNMTVWKQLTDKMKINPEDPNVLENQVVKDLILARINSIIQKNIGMIEISRITLLLQPWTIDNNLITPTGKLKRSNLCITYAEVIDRMY